MVNSHVNDYRVLRPELDLFRKKLETLIQALLESKGIDVHVLESRCKDVESFSEKCSRKSYKVPLREMTDLVGLRIVTYYDDEVSEVRDMLRAEFNFDKANSVNKNSQLQPDQFGYRSDHLILRLSPTRTELTEWERYKMHCFEVQVRSVLQHAWAAIDHKLIYKADKADREVPAVLRRRMYRLGALLELADDEFRAIREDISNLKEEIKESVQTGNSDIELDLVSLTGYFSSSQVVEDLANIAVSSGWLPMPDQDKLLNAIRLSENGSTDERLASRMQESLARIWTPSLQGSWRVLPLCGVNTIAKLDILVKETLQHAGPLLTAIRKEAVMRGFTPTANPIDPITLFVLHKNRRNIDPDEVMRLITWGDAAKGATRKVIFSTHAEDGTQD